MWYTASSLLLGNLSSLIDWFYRLWYSLERSHHLLRWLLILPPGNKAASQLFFLPRVAGVWAICYRSKFPWKCTEWPNTNWHHLHGFYNTMAARLILELGKDKHKPPTHTSSTALLPKVHTTHNSIYIIWEEKQAKATHQLYWIQACILEALVRFTHALNSEKHCNEVLSDIPENIQGA